MADVYKAHNDIGAIRAISVSMAESAVTIADLQSAPQPTLAYIGADDQLVVLARRQAEALPCRLEIVPGDHIGAFAQSDKVVPFVKAHIDASTSAAPEGGPAA